MFFSLSFAADTLAFCVFACLTLIQSAGWLKIYDNNNNNFLLWK